MKSSNPWKIIISSIVVIIVIAGALLLSYRHSPHVHPQIKSFSVDPQKGFVVTSQGLSRVEIWIVPTGTNIGQNGNQLLEGTQLSSEDGGVQTWTATRPSQPILVTEIYARGYDDKGNEVNQLPLPYRGATDIFNAVWGPATTTTSS